MQAESNPCQGNCHGANTDFLLPIYHSGSTNTNFNAYFWLLLLDKKKYFLQYVLVYTQPTQIRR